MTIDKIRSALRSAFRHNSVREELPDIFAAKPAKPAPAPKPVQKSLPVLVNEETRTFEFSVLGKQTKTGNAAALTPAEIAVLEARNCRNHARNLQAKPMWARGDTTAQAAAQLGCSQSSAEKIFAALSKANAEK